MDIKVGALEVLESGCVNSVNGHDVLFSLSKTVNVRLVFASGERKDVEMKSLINDNGELEFRLTNFDNPLGTEFTEAFEIGTFQGRKLHFHVRVTGMRSTTNKVIFFTFYLGDAISNG